jgi:hypothetical protein
MCTVNIGCAGLSLAGDSALQLLPILLLRSGLPVATAPWVR